MDTAQTTFKLGLKAELDLTYSTEFSPVRSTPAWIYIYNGAQIVPRKYIITVRFSKPPAKHIRAVYFGSLLYVACARDGLVHVSSFICGM